jgi:hypothetical protein
VPFQARLKALLDTHGATYVFGHDHCAQALRDGPTFHHGVGGAHELEPYDQSTIDVFRQDCPSCETLYYAPGQSFAKAKDEGAFATFDFSAERVLMRHFHSNGTQLFEGEQLPRGVTSEA